MKNHQLKKLDKMLYQFGGVINQPLDDGRSLLHEATKAPYCTAVMEYLVRSGANPNQPDRFLETPLHFAVASGRSSYDTRAWIWEDQVPVSGCRLDVIALLLAHNGDPNAPNDHGVTPFHLALARGQLDVARMLLDHGADVRVKDNRGRSAMHYAARSGDQDVLLLVINRGGIVNDQSKYQETALHIVASTCNLPCIEVLLDNGANIDIKDNAQETPFFRVIARDATSTEASRKTVERILGLLLDQSAAGLRTSLPSLVQGRHLVRSEFEMAIIVQELAKFLTIEGNDVDGQISAVCHGAFEYLEECQQELTVSQNCRIYEGGWLTMWDIIVGSPMKLLNYAGNKNLMAAVSSHLDKFPFYRRMIWRKVQRGVLRKERLTAEMNKLAGCFPVSLPRKILEKIILHRDN